MTDANNPIKEWMEVGRSTVAPELDEEDTDSDCPIPSHLVTDIVDPNDLRCETGASNLSEWAERTIGDTHVGKRKTSTMQPPRRGKKTKGKGKEIVASDDSTDADAGKSPLYQTSNDSSSNTGSDDNDGGDNSGSAGAGAGCGRSLEPGYHEPLSPFTNDQFTHATQDQDHGVPTSHREVTGPDVGTQHGYVGYSETEESSSSSTLFGINVPSYDYQIPDAQTQPPVRWVHEWIDQEFYEMLYSEWQTTAHWTGQTWHEYKAELLRCQGIMLVSTKDYHAMHLHR